MSRQNQTSQPLLSLRFARSLSAWLVAIATVVLAPGVTAETDARFDDIARDPASGLAYARVPSADFALVETFREGSLEEPVTFFDNALAPHAARGYPGVAVLDHDGDGDLDIFVTNGPGAPHSLFENQLAESGTTRFVDVAAAAGLAAPEMDGNGVCHGDIDNDGDPDLLVLGRESANRLFENLGDGTFRHVVASGLAGGGRSHVGCSMGDVDGDGLLDVVVANSFDPSQFLAILAVPFALNQHNQLFRNEGGLTFSDVSAAAGIESLDAVPPGAATITWATTIVDIDLDGDLDIVFGDDTGALPTTKLDPVNGIDRGFLQVLENDGTGHFTAHAVRDTPESVGAHMGLGFGDLNCDGQLDILSSNLGDYFMSAVGMPYILGDQATRPFFGNGDGSFEDPGLGDFVSSAFGWGNAIFDIDNDGDSDALYHGGLDINLLVVSDNPGVVIENEGCGEFSYDLAALNGRHLRRNVRGVAIGDLDRNGFVDVVSAANATIPEPLPLVPMPASYGGPLDATAFFVPLFAPVGPGLFVWTGLDLHPGDLSVEIHRGNDHGAVTVRAVGAVDLVGGGRVNRDGIGAVVMFTPEDGSTAMMPITGGSSHLSAHATEAYFGLGDAPRGTVEVLWPGGVRNRLYDVAAGESVVLPEIPCSFDGAYANRGKYVSCVTRALNDLAAAGVIAPSAKNRYLKSAKRAFEEAL